MVTPVAKREAVAHLKAHLGLSERRACQIAGADRKMVRYQSQRAPDTALRGRLRDLANERRRFGYRRLFVLLRREGEASGINRIYRLYREEGLTVRKRKARRKAIGTRAPILIEARANARWSLDFVHDQFACGRRFRVLNVVDDVTRECLAAIPDTSISGRRVARELAALIERRGKPGMIVSDRAIVRHWFKDNGEGDGTDLERHPEVVRRAQGRMALHRAGKAHAERLRRKLQRSDAGRVSERDAVPQPRPCPRSDRGLGQRLQHRKAPFSPRIPNPRRLRPAPDRRNRPSRCTQ
jgi:transposase InsO family protein